MSNKLTMPQAQLLREVKAAGRRGLFKSTAYSPANILVSLGLVKWERKFDNGRMGTLVITRAGQEFGA